MKKLAQHLAKAILELDRASWSVVSQSPQRRAVEEIRLALWRELEKTGYEFAAPDSARVRKIKLDAAA